jgi:16S rRNA (cytidine1402-2'-O)-methyltransferase
VDAAPLPELDFPPGSCFFVGTPIGNLDDMSPRGLAALAAADAVYAEDTRRTRRLLSRYGVRARLEAYHDHNKERQVPRIVERLRRGERVAVVSDAGMPAVADPGYVLLQALRREELPWSVVPGPSSVLAALVLAGFPTDRFLFVGYPPRRAGRLRAFLAGALAEPGTVVMLESVHRVRKTLAALAEMAPAREMAVVREITKLHEETLRGTADVLLEEMTGPRLKGELVLVLRGNENPEGA